MSEIEYDAGETADEFPGQWICTEADCGHPVEASLPLYMSARRGQEARMSRFLAPEQLDDRDAAILAERTASYDAIPGPRVGDFVIFAGSDHRISHIWDFGSGPETIQTSNVDGGSYYLQGGGFVSHSGGLSPGVKPETLTPTDQMRRGSVWFFHHDRWQADNGIDTIMSFRVFTCSEPAPR